jgi:ABC-type molybdate transport system permease subunit
MTHTATLWVLAAAAVGIAVAYYLCRKSTRARDLVEIADDVTDTWEE